MNPLSAFLRAAAVTAILCSGLPVFAKGHHLEAYRSKEECSNLPGTDTRGERAACFHCIARPDPHAYHYTSKFGHRCKEDSAEDKSKDAAAK